MQYFIKAGKDGLFSIQQCSVQIEDQYRFLTGIQFLESPGQTGQTDHGHADADQLSSLETADYQTVSTVVFNEESYYAIPGQIAEESVASHLPAVSSVQLDQYPA